MTDMEFLQMLSGIDEDLVTKADRPVPFRQKRGFKIMLVAAVLAFALLITPVAGAFALAVGYIATRDHVNDGSEPQDPTQGDAEQNVAHGGLVGELIGGIDWGALKDTIGADGNVNWKDFFAVLQGNSSETVSASGHVFEAVKLDDGTMKITKFVNNGNETVVFVPETISGAKVTVIGAWAFAENQNLTHVSLPDTVKVIENSAFHSCTKLVTVDYPDNLVEIGKYAFAACSSLTNCDLPYTLQTLGSFAFMNCDITDVTIPASLKSWGNDSFEACLDLKTLIIEDGIKEIPAESFRGAKIQEVIIPSSVTSIGDRAFQDCDALQSISLPEGLTEIGHDAFAGTAITNITIPSTVTTMGDMLFSGCENLETVIFAGDAPEVLYFESATGLAPNTAYNIYHPLGANGFTEPEWQGHPCQAMLYEAEDFILEKLPDYPGYQSTLPYYSWSVLATEQTQGKGRPLEVINNYPSFQYYQSEYSFLPDDTAYDVKYFRTNALIIAQVKVSPKEELVRLSGIVLRQDGAATEVYPIFTFNSQPERDESYTYTYVLIEVPKNDWKNLTVGAYAESHIYSHNVYPDGIARSHHYYGFLDRHASYPSDKETDTACG